MLRTITVARAQRVALFLDGRYQRLLGPGRHTVWVGLSTVETVCFSFDDVAARCDGRDGVPAELEEARLIEVGPHQVGVLRVDSQDRQVLTPGRYRLWRTGSRQELTLHDVLAEPRALPPEDRLQVGSPSAWLESSSDADCAVVLLRDQRAVRVLPPGRYRTWTAGPWRLVPVDLGPQVLELAAQDVVTLDQVPVRVKPAGAWRVADPLRRVAAAHDTQPLYGAVQLALREVLAARSLDALTEGREGLSDALLDRARARLPPDLGVALDAVWIKDLILPGEVKEVLHKVTLARKEAEAIAIRRREEVAHTRQLANTARLLEQSPVLLRLKELEAMGELLGALSGKLEKLVVVTGDDLGRRVGLRVAADEAG